MSHNNNQVNRVQYGNQKKHNRHGVKCRSNKSIKRDQMRLNEKERDQIRLNEKERDQMRLNEKERDQMRLNDNTDKNMRYERKYIDADNDISTYDIQSKRILAKQFERKQKRMNSFSNSEYIIVTANQNINTNQSDHKYTSLDIQKQNIIDYMNKNSIEKKGEGIVILDNNNVLDVFPMECSGTYSNCSCYLCKGIDLNLRFITALLGPEWDLSRLDKYKKS